jgi:hypothetical protein
LKHNDGLIREEAERAWKPPEGQEDSRVLGSANQLFLKIRASLNRCVKLVSRGNTLLRLSGAFKVRMGWPFALLVALAQGAWVSGGDLHIHVGARLHAALLKPAKA